MSPFSFSLSQEEVAQLSELILHITESGGPERKIVVGLFINFGIHDGNLFGNL